MFDCIIIGNGPAGISASLYVRRAGLNCAVIGKDGGALLKTDKIENYYGFVEPISGEELINNGINQAKRLGVEIINEEVLGVEYVEYFTVKTNKNNYKAMSVILATGASRKVPSINGIKDFEGKGISYCATCDGFFYKGKDIAVLGDGEYALDEIQHLLPIAKSIVMLTNGKPALENRGLELEVNEKEISGFQGEKALNKVVFKDDSTLEVSGVFVAEGTASSVDFAKRIGAMIEDNHIVVDGNMKTTIDGLYAAGDCVGGFAQISKAVYEGAIAGTQVIKYVRNLK